MTANPSLVELERALSNDWFGDAESEAALWMHRDLILSSVRLAQLVREAGLVEALKPFADAAENLEDWQNDAQEMWEDPTSMQVTVGDFRRARAVLATLVKELADE